MSAPSTADVVGELRRIRRARKRNAEAVSLRMGRCRNYVQILESRVLNHGRDLTVSVLMEYMDAIGARMVFDVDDEGKEVPSG